MKKNIYICSFVNVENFMVDEINMALIIRMPSLEERASV